MIALFLLALAASLSTSCAQYQGFNYGALYPDGSGVTESGFHDDFTTAKSLAGTSGFTSARLYTMIQAGTTNTPTEAIPAAIDTHTSLLLGLWASAGQANIDNEITALESAIAKYGKAFTDLIAGISAGSEDLYRISPTGVMNKSGAGANPDDIVSYISQIRRAIAGTTAHAVPVGHVDTWTAWVNGSNKAVSSACDFIGMDAYPYFQTTQANTIDNGHSLFFDAYAATIAAVDNKPVWVTETGWPVSGPTENFAVPSIPNAKTYWDQVACELLGKTNTWWYTLQDASPNAPGPSFGIVGSQLTTNPLYDLSCSVNSSSSAVSSAAYTSAVSSTISVVATSSTPLASGDTTSSLSTTDKAPESASKTSSSWESISTSAMVSITSSEVDKDSPTAITDFFPSSTASSTLVSSQSMMWTSMSRKSNTTWGTAATGSEVPVRSIMYTTVVVYTTVAVCPASSHVTLYSNSYGLTTLATSTTPVGSAIYSGSPSVGTATQATITATSVLPSATAGSSSCPASLSGSFEYPHLIVHVNSSAPDQAGGNSFNGLITPTISSIFNFDIPEDDAGKTCTLIFLLPTKDQLETSAYTLTANGMITVAKLQSPGLESTTFNTVPAVKKALGSFVVTPGNSYVIASFSCPAGKRVGYEFSSKYGLDLEYFEDYNPHPIGVFITVC